jgi:hypothetical protein
MATVADTFKSFLETANTAFRYNLQVFPDTLTAGALLFSLLFQSPPLAALGGSMILLTFLHPLLAQFTARTVSATLGAEVDPGLCSGHFPGVSYDQLLSMSSEKTFGALNRSGWPSYYTVFMGFLGAWVSALPVIYHKEQAASPKRKTASTVGLIVLALVLLMMIVYRIGSGCDTPLGVFVGLAAGALVGGLMVTFLAWISERRLTNLLAYPLLRGRAGDGKPIYVCQK